MLLLLSDHHLPPSFLSKSRLPSLTRQCRGGVDESCLSVRVSSHEQLLTGTIKLFICPRSPILVYNLICVPLFICFLVIYTLSFL